MNKYRYVFRDRKYMLRRVKLESRKRVGSSVEKNCSSRLVVVVVVADGQAAIQSDQIKSFHWESSGVGPLGLQFKVETAGSTCIKDDHALHSLN